MPKRATGATTKIDCSKVKELTRPFRIKRKNKVFHEIAYLVWIH
jgi:hypothetical protein